MPTLDRTCATGFKVCLPSNALFKESPRSVVQEQCLVQSRGGTVFHLVDSKNFESRSVCEYEGYSYSSAWFAFLNCRAALDKNLLCFSRALAGMCSASLFQWLQLSVENWDKATNSSASGNYLLVRLYWHLLHCVAAYSYLLV